MTVEQLILELAKHPKDALVKLPEDDSGWAADVQAVVSGWESKRTFTLTTNRYRANRLKDPRRVVVLL